MPKSLLKSLSNGVLVLIYYFKKHFKSFFILKTFCSTLDSKIGELEDSFVDDRNTEQVIVLIGQKMRKISDL